MLLVRPILVFTVLQYVYCSVMVLCVCYMFLLCIYSPFGGKINISIYLYSDIVIIGDDLLLLLLRHVWGDGQHRRYNGIHIYLMYKLYVLLLLSFIQVVDWLQLI